MKSREPTWWFAVEIAVVAGAMGMVALALREFRAHSGHVEGVAVVAVGVLARAGEALREWRERSGHVVVLAALDAVLGRSRASHDESFVTSPPNRLSGSSNRQGVGP